MKYSPWLKNFGLTVVVSTRDTGIYAQIATVDSVPEPSTWAMMLIGLVGLGLYARRKSAHA
ncbi:MAG: PEPxxWA-CTERM sorting domain-containing protein [Planctomycetia bacterium]|nr:PEPxxWA-CTERM sorting domain-containing protein [Planctomycetia bacterium]